ncbi:paired amphipathic helix protein Sin3-like 5 isoform X2 [Ananas comosus]|uniref:Paired amphipathic helix protein Sin3-like 5 isoform X2 n=1 Tax=Ananas comosus TaxID=4615 RepID=A0A6P5G0F3_ANACO|nr:paired amphipathic helix protein Sin3-like 5 isoform X2 [Ananas comosus]
MSSQYPMDTQAAESNNRKLVSPNVMDFLLYAKKELENDQDTYNKFHHIILKIRHQSSVCSRFDAEEILLSVRELLKCYPTIHHGFECLLKGLEVAPVLFKDGICVNSASDLIHEIQNCFGDDGSSFESFANILKMCQAEELDIYDARWKLRRLLRKRRELFADLIKFLPLDRTSKQKERTTVVKHAQKDKYGREDQDGRDIEQDETKLVHDTMNLNNLACKRKPAESNNSFSDEHLQKESFYNEEHMRRSSSPDDGSMKNEMDKIENGDCHNSKTEEKDTTDIFASRDALFHDGYRRCNPSYRTRSKDYPFPAASCRTELDASVLNDTLCCKTSGSECFFQRMQKNDYEWKLFECEERRYELDMLTKLVKATSKKVEKLSCMVEKNKTKPEKQRRIINRLTSSHLTCIERLYGEYGLDFIDILHNNPSSALPVLLKHLKKKKNELLWCEASQNKVWAKIIAKYHLKSLDYCGPYFKQHDPTAFSDEVLLAEIKEANEKKRNKGRLIPSNITGNTAIKTPDMEFDYIELDIHEDLYDIIKNTCGQSGIAKEQLNEIMGIWSTVIESMLGVSHVLKAAKSDCNNSSQKVGYDDPAPSERGEKLRKVPKTNHGCASESNNKLGKYETSPHARSVYQASVRKLVSCDDGEDDESAQRSRGNNLNLLVCDNAKLLSCKDCNYEHNIDVERMADTQTSEGEGTSWPSLYPYLDDKEEECSRVFYGNSSFYVLFRLHQILYKRLLFAKTMSTMNDKSSNDLYEKFKVSLYRLLGKSSGNSEYEDDCFAILGTQSYVLFTLDKLIDRVLKQLDNIMSSSQASEFLQLHANVKTIRLGKSSNLGYYEKARALLPNESIFRFESFGNPTRLSIELINCGLEETEGADVPMDEDV